MLHPRNMPARRPAADVQRLYSAAESVSGVADSNATLFHGTFNQLLELKAKYPYLKVFISIGGYSWSGNFSNAAITEASRKAFVSSCIDLYFNTTRVFLMASISTGASGQRWSDQGAPGR